MSLGGLGPIEGLTGRWQLAPSEMQRIAGHIVDAARQAPDLYRQPPNLGAIPDGPAKPRTLPYKLSDNYLSLAYQVLRFNGLLRTAGRCRINPGSKLLKLPCQGANFDEVTCVDRDSADYILRDSRP